MTVFTLGKGAVLAAVAVGSSTAAVPVKQLKTISFSGNGANYEDITNMDSPGAVMEFAPTTISPGTAAVQGVFNDADPGQVLMAAAHAAQTLLTFTLQFLPKTGQTVGFLRTFEGYVQEWNGPDAQFDKASTASGTLKISGVVTDVAGH